MRKILMSILAMLISGIVFADQIMDSIERKQDDKLIEALKSGADANKNYKHHGGFRNISPIVWAIKKKNTSALKILLENGGNPNSLGGYFKTPALSMVAATSSIPTNQKIEMSKILLSHGANINATDADNYTVLHAAVGGSDGKYILYLLQNGADKNLKNNDGITPLGLASSMRKSDAAAALK